MSQSPSANCVVSNETAVVEVTVSPACVAKATMPCRAKAVVVTGVDASAFVYPITTVPCCVEPLLGEPITGGAVTVSKVTSRCGDWAFVPWSSA